MHERRMGRGFCHQRTVHLIGPEDSGALPGFVFLTHARPRVGVNSVRSLGRNPRLCEQFDSRSRLCGDLPRISNDLRIRQITLRRSDPDRRPQARARQQQRMGYVIAIPYVCERDIPEIAKPLLQREVIRQRLARDAPGRSGR